MSPPSQDQALPRLVVDGPDRVRGQVFRLDDEPLLVGRDSTCRLQLVHPLLSRRHAVVWWAGGHTTVEDLSSTNGTRLNGHRVHGQRILRDGDVLGFGPLEAHYEEPAEAVTEIADPDASDEGTEPPTVTTGERPPTPRHGAEGVSQPEPVAAFVETAPQEQARQEQARPPEMPPEPVWPGPAPPEPGAGPSAHRAPPPPAAPPRPHAPPPGAPPAGAPPAEAPPADAARHGDDRRFDVGRQGAAGNLSNVAGSQYNESPHFDLGNQVAKENLNNVGRDQVNNFFQNDHIQLARRETFFRKIAAARTMARHLLVTGLVLALLGSAFLGWEGSYPEVLSERIQGIAHNASIVLGVTGAALLLLGGALLIRSVVRQRRYERDEESRLNPGPSPSG
ncbi:FHA domain-containing protein [Kitasatospora sp. NPDC057500]|uniref:FHA domain-containing protein n=1 Tax=Kitasatospora sp. NPDC057500 TaxID=3346151 RepID=UPI00368F6F80